MIDQMISHYRVLEKLGEGGMGVVYKAQDTKLDRLVALKFLPHRLGTDEKEKQRFIQEARAASALDHPNICTIHEIDETDDGQMFIAMAYYEGETLKEKISQGPLEPREALDIAIQIARGLGKAHEREIVHRDMKPANVVITKDAVPKIVDFGLAKLAGRTRITKTGTTVGTAAYMSPEQALGQETDHRTDIWSLGVILYEMLTGVLPFRADIEAALMYLIVNEQPSSVSNINPKIPREMDSVVVKLLEKDVTLRYQTMDEVVGALHQLRMNMEAAQQGGRGKNIVVLPFENISAEKENEYFSDGLTEELIANLSKLKEIQVISRTTTMQYKGTKKDTRTIGRELSARYILEGSVRKYQDNLRITAQLIDVETDAHLWAETYKGKLADVFDIQEEVSRQIVEALRVELTPIEKIGLTKRSTLSAEAFDCNLRARDFLYQSTKNSVQFAVQLFQRAIEIDPRYAAAYAGLGEAYATLYQRFERKETWIEKAIESSLKALMYDSTSSEAYAALGFSYFNKKMFEEALTATQKAIELDPNNFSAYWILGRLYHTTDREREAVDVFKKVVVLNPDFYSAIADLVGVYERLGEKEKYEEALRNLLQMFPRYLSRHPDDARAHMFYAIALAQSQKLSEGKVEALKALELSPGDPLMMYNAACFYARVGEKRLALETLKNAVTSGFEYYEWIKRDPDLESIRNESEYIELMKEK
jgi:serine/threonine protein kinase/tetratricopeptide (TPR) repeat protein